ncbi:hypothetical protein MJD09_11460, partial [bacterium]|nr:hypothetical protein [bacterium]
MLAFILPTLIFAGTWARANLYYLLPIYPALAVLAGMFVSDILGYLSHKGWRVAAAVCLILPPVLKGVYYDIRLTQPDSRAVAESWIKRKIPEDSKIAYENYVYGPNLFDPIRYFGNEFESGILPAELKERILEERRRRISYHLVNFRKAFNSEPLSNGDISKGYLQTPYFQRLVRFRLPTLSVLREAGIEYVLASSENYDRYFKGKPPKESAPAWLSYQNGRRFYRELFRSKDLSLVREFQPNRWSMGPTIRLYRFHDK